MTSADTPRYGRIRRTQGFHRHGIAPPYPDYAVRKVGDGIKDYWIVEEAQWYGEHELDGWETVLAGIKYCPWCGKELE